MPTDPRPCINATPAVHTHTGDEAPEAMDDNEQPPFTTLTAQKSQIELHSIYAGADGVMDEVEEIMMKYDADQSGCFSVAEVKAIIKDLENHRKQAKHIFRALLLTIVVALVVLGTLFVMMFL
eukprot:CAMPEP_0115105656 /NCGR_PEP_ID=MMETSP0227-20121206/36138_1 /TAXON_ID=89957 /ORGANISM="Polarella glacialis, Strain CCMP 1383" /LENGTH=122 /DNA_ID=CAMNT_0002503001 /DNA_START=167 /DNA_END=531 /DNA_ORIENTATION=+